MSVDVPFSRTENKRATKLEGVLPQFVLAVSLRLRTLTRDKVFLLQHVQEACVFKVNSRVSLALRIHQERECHIRFPAELLRILLVAEANGGDTHISCAKLLFVGAQLRHMLSAKNSAIVTQESYDARLFRPERTQADLITIRVGQNNRRQPRTE
jgi:hypothetical protein